MGTPRWAFRVQIAMQLSCAHGLQAFVAVLLVAAFSWVWAAGGRCAGQAPAPGHAHHQARALLPVRGCIPPGS